MQTAPYELTPSDEIYFFVQGLLYGHCPYPESTPTIIELHDEADQSLQRALALILQAKHESWSALDIEFLVCMAKDRKKTLDTLTRRINNMQPGYQEISKEQIENARNYPVTSLIDFGRKGKARCLWHAEKTPSMGHKNNRVKCFGCGKSADAIEIAMLLNKWSFHQAVANLAGI